MTFQDGEHFLWLHATRRQAVGPSGECETRFEIEARIKSSDASFRVRTRVRVDAAGLQAFLGDLRTVEATRRGAAVLRSADPGDFELAVRIYDDSGHVGAFGKVGHWYPIGVEGPYWGEVNFGIPFDSSALPEVLRQVTALEASGPFDLPDDEEEGCQQAG